MAKVIEVTGFDELLKALEESPRRVMPYMVKAMQTAVRAVQEKISEYPPATAANQPGRYDSSGRPMGYYERGRGWWYPVMQKKTLGKNIGVGFGAETAKRAVKRNRAGSLPARVAGYKLARGGTSEMLGRSWAVTVETTENAVVGIIGNNASYADYVQGTRQARYMQKIGWTDINEAVELATPEINAAFEASLGEYTKQI